ncbi:MAG: protein kinase [Firmicutes bacterium]|nr:protein kinase [Bacillota bacterium]
MKIPSAIICENSDSELVRLIKTMAQAELIIARFYNACANCWNSENSFWLKIRDEEIGHANAIARILRFVQQDPEIIQASLPVSVIDINLLIGSIGGLTERVKRKELNKGIACAVARDVESSLIEIKYLDNLKTKSPIIRQIVEVIYKQTKEHENKFNQALLDARNEEEKKRKEMPLSPEEIFTAENLFADEDDESSLKLVDTRVTVDESPYFSKFEPLNLMLEFETNQDKSGQVSGPKLIPPHQLFAPEVKKKGNPHYGAESPEDIYGDDSFFKKRNGKPDEVNAKPVAADSEKMVAKKTEDSVIINEESVSVESTQAEPALPFIKTDLSENIPSLEIGSIFYKQFMIVKCINRRANGSTYIVESMMQKSRYFILKEFYLEDFTAEQEKSLNAVLDELVGTLQGVIHINLIRLYQAFIENGRIYFLMEKIDGMDLAKLAALYNKPFSQREIVRYGMELCNALEYLHNTESIFSVGDFKPEHIILDLNGILKLVNYNLDRYLICSGDSCSRAVSGVLFDDITSVARVLYFLANLREYTSEGAGGEWRANIAPELKKTLLTACEKGQRVFGNAAGFRRELEGSLGI